MALPDRAGSPAEDELLQRLRVARTAFLEGADPGEAVRPEIRRSWYRSLKAGVSPTEPIDLQSGPGVDLDSLLLRAARPVVQALLDDFGDARLWIQLIDRDAQIIGRWATSEPFVAMLDEICAVGSVIDEGLVGTTVLATVMEERRPITVWGPEHFHQNLGLLSGAGAPIVHPGSGVLQGVVSVGCDLMVPIGLVSSLVNQAARDIGAALVTGYSRADRELLDAYLQVERRGPRRPMIAVNSRVWMSNTAASAWGLMLPGHADLWERVQRSVRAAADGEEITVHGVRLCVRPVRSGDDLIGGLVQVVGHDKGPRVHPARPLSGATVLARPTGAFGVVQAGAERLLRTAPRSLFHGPRHAGKATIAQRAAERLGLTMLSCTATELIDADVPADLDTLEPTCLLVRRLDAVEVDRVPALEEVLRVASGRVAALVATYRTAQAGAELPTWLEPAFDAYLRVPGIAETPADLPLLVAELLGVEPSELAAAIDPDVVRSLQERTLPGNVEQLKRVLHRARTLAGEGPITAEHLPPTPGKRGFARRLTPLERVERDAIAAVLLAHDGNKAAAAQQLEMSRSTFYRRLAHLGLA